MRIIVEVVEGLIRQRRYRRLSRALFKAGYALSRVCRSTSLERLILQAMMLDFQVNGDARQASQLLLRFADRHAVSWPMLRDYIDGGDLSSSSMLLDSSALSPPHKIVLHAAKLRAEGELDQAISKLANLSPESFDLKQYRVNMLRNLYHQKHAHEQIAELLTDFMDSEPTRTFIKQGIAAASSAEAAQREDLFARAINHVMDDIQVTLSDKKVFKRRWKDALEGSLSIFDIEGATRILDRAEDEGYDVSKQTQNIQEIQDDLGPIRHIIDQARRDILVRCGRSKPLPRRAEAVVVMPAAALRSNKIDYPGFRGDIRRCLTSIVQTLEQDRIPFCVKSRIRTHGTISLDLPFFSYHTKARGERTGLHFKETDRPSLFSFDDQGYAGWSSFAQTPIPDLHLESVDLQRANHFFELDRDAIFKERLSKYVQRNLNEELPRRFVFVALQVVGDAVESLAYTTPFAMLDQVIETCKNLGLAVVVKRHPACKSPQISQYLREHSDDVVIANGNIHDIIPASLAVCVINSGVGAEALLYEKPVYVFGRADYMAACFICKYPEDFSRHFKVGSNPLSPKDLRRFWYIYRNYYACNVRRESESKMWIASRVRQHLMATAYACPS
jgi:hypothetical protein